LSFDISKSTIATSLRFWRAAQSADSFTRFARSAPENPGVPRAITQDVFAALHVRARHHNAAVKTAGPQKRRIENVRPVRRGNQDYAFVRFESVHFHEQRVQGLLAFIVSAAQARAAVPSDGVDFVDEDDARRIFLALLEKIANAACAYADEHLNEVRT
jgi:hypothetical protein